MKLELKIPPLLLGIAFALLMWLVSSLPPVILFPETFRLVAVACLIFLGGFLAIAGVASFRKAETTVNPTTPDAASMLVTSGVYNFTRNPMYLGVLLLLIGWGIYLSSFYALVLSAGFVLYMNRFQIRPEERALDSLFGADYQAYKRRVRRWL